MGYLAEQIALVELGQTRSRDWDAFVDGGWEDLLEDDDWEAVRALKALPMTDVGAAPPPPPPPPPGDVPPPPPGRAPRRRRRRPKKRRGASAEVAGVNGWGRGAPARVRAAPRPVAVPPLVRRRRSRDVGGACVPGRIPVQRLADCLAEEFALRSWRARHQKRKSSVDSVRQAQTSIGSRALRGSMALKTGTGSTAWPFARAGSKQQNGHQRHLALRQVPVGA